MRYLRPLHLRVVVVAWLFLSGGWAWSQSRVLVVHATDVQRHPVAGLLIGVQGDGGSAVTDQRGGARIMLSSGIRSGDWVDLRIVKSPPGKDYVMLSPWDSRASVPPFENKTENFVEVVVAQRGDRAALENGSVLAALTAKINKANSPTTPTNSALSPEEQRRLDLLAVSRQFGISPEELDRAIRGFEPKVQQRRAAALAASRAYDLPPEVVSQALDALMSQSGNEGSKEKVFQIEFEADIPPELRTEKEAIVNGQRLQVQGVNPSLHEITVLGPPSSNPVRNGLNSWVRTGKKEYFFWSEERKLRQFENPYKNSYAIIAAIDNYDRLPDAASFPSLRGTMVKGAEYLKLALKKNGFAEDHIFTFYDAQATSVALNDALSQFWEGNRYASADRLFFYFGGHGTHKGKIGFLVTYDYDPKRPTTTTLLMKDLTTRHAENIVAHHVLFALDSCDSGLALPSLGTGTPTEEELRKFRQLRTIRSDTDDKARNLLVAGTLDQKALWQNGGVFTKALITGLNGEADLNHDGLIEFDELALYVRQEVQKNVEDTGVRQDPDGYVLTNFGQGRVIFIPQSR